METAFLEKKSSKLVIRNVIFYFTSWKWVAAERPAIVKFSCYRENNSFENRGKLSALNS
jgi:hypothetical protein